jgi:hypothetical protein
LTVRYVNRVLIVVLALVLAGTGAGVAVEIGLAALARPPLVLPYPQLADVLGRSRWADAPVVAVLAGVALLGLVLLAGQLVPRRTRLVPIADPVPGVSTATTRRSLERVLRRAASGADGITTASVRATPRRIRVRAVTRLRDATGLHAGVVAAVGDQLDGIGLARRPAISVSVRQKESR